MSIEEDKLTTLADLPLLYQKRLLISQIKLDHLQKLKKILPSDYHSFYEILYHINE